MGGATGSSMTLPTCVGKRSEYGLFIRLVVAFEP
jgi:hypothetical protein